MERSALWTTDETAVLLLFAGRASVTPAAETFAVLLTLPLAAGLTLHVLVNEIV
jgi:hypothetical protein